ncbi:hypothetical protein [Falsibacillus pallidus]|uniref:hypothetical protein n=1 Tax=Falsibacillus pallidus TaxID=493781 RepID=UPI003D96B4A0
MNKKELALSITLNAFLGYLWILFIDHIVRVANSLENTYIVGGLIILIGTILFWGIIKRVNPYNEYKFTHPIIVAGFISFGAVVIVNLYVLNLI